MTGLNTANAPQSPDGGIGGWTPTIPTGPGWTPGGPGGGGGNGDSTQIPPVPSTTSICDRGWMRYIPGINCPGTSFPEPPPGYNAYQADTVKVDTSLTNPFPCFQKIIDTLSTYGNLNQKAQVALSQIFGVYKYMHITLKLDPSLSGTNIDANTSSPGPSGFPPDTLNFTATINFNPDLLINGTKEYIAATITHEAMHAYIDYIFQQYQNGYIDSNQVKALFPIFWHYVGYTSFALQQHNLMANNWVNTISNSLTAFSNSPGQSIALRDSIYNALGWGGLGATDAFARKTDRCDAAAINFVAKDKTWTSPFTMTLPGLPPCPTTYTITAANLKLRGICN